MSTAEAALPEVQGSLITQFETADGERTGPQLDVPIDTTAHQLQAPSFPRCMSLPVHVRILRAQLQGVGGFHAAVDDAIPVCRLEA
eukprot:6194551-Pleurochrysis_carterae.AAC.2